MSEANVHKRQKEMEWSKVHLPIPQSCFFWIVSEQPQSTAWTGFEDLGAAIGLCCVKEREEDIKVEEGDAEWGRKGR